MLGCPYGRQCTHTGSLHVPGHRVGTAAAHPTLLFPAWGPPSQACGCHDNCSGLCRCRGMHLGGAEVTWAHYAMGPPAGVDGQLPWQHTSQAHLGNIKIPSPGVFISSRNRGI